MVSFVLLVLFVVFSALMMFLSSPLAVGMMLLLMAGTASCFISLSSSFLALLLFLIYVGGIMMMFAYFIATAPNFKVIFEMRPLGFFLPVMVVGVPWVMFMPSNYLSLGLFTGEHGVLVPYVSVDFVSVIFLMVVLLFTMMVVVKVAVIEAAPMRPFK